MRISRRFLGVSLACLPLLAACERAPAPIDYKLDGTWAWGTEMNCYGNENTIVFDGGRIQVFLHGDMMVSVQDARFAQASRDGKPLITVRYNLQGRDFEEEYVALDGDTLRPVETEVNGSRQISAAGSGKTLVRCPTPPAP